MHHVFWLMHLVHVFWLMHLVFEALRHGDISDTAPSQDRAFTPVSTLWVVLCPWLWKQVLRCTVCSAENNVTDKGLSTGVYGHPLNW